MSEYPVMVPDWLAPWVLNDYNPLELWWRAHWHTQCIEVPIYFLLLCWFFRRWWIPLPLGLFVNLVTHPLLWYYFPWFEPDPSYLAPLVPAGMDPVYITWLVIAESCVVAIEGLLVALAITLWGKEGCRAPAPALFYGFAVAFVANVPSTLAGLFL